MKKVIAKKVRTKKMAELNYPKYSDSDIEIAKHIDKNFNYIVRNKNGDLYLFRFKPVRYEEKGIWQIGNEAMCEDLICALPIDAFEEIKYTDEPTKISDIIRFVPDIVSDIFSDIYYYQKFDYAELYFYNDDSNSGFVNCWKDGRNVVKFTVKKYLSQFLTCMDEGENYAPEDLHVAKHLLLYED